MKIFNGIDGKFVYFPQLSVMEVILEIVHVSKVVESEKEKEEGTKRRKLSNCKWNRKRNVKVYYSSNSPQTYYFESSFTPILFILIRLSISHHQFHSRSSSHSSQRTMRYKDYYERLFLTESVKHPVHPASERDFWNKIDLY